MEPQESNLCKMVFASQQQTKIQMQTTEHRVANSRCPVSVEHQMATEVEVLAKQILTTLYEQDVSMDTTVATLQRYPEVAWLTQCASQCPLPPFWTKHKDS